ncbi:MAG: NAD-binding protein [Cyanobacteria bacterium P01_G01_bin.38]
MYLIVVGAGPEGIRFIDMAAAQHEVILIEKDEQRARKVLKENNIRVLRGDIAEDNILQEAEIDRADAIVATTHDDSTNLMAMVLAKEYGVKTCISLINQQSHSQMFERLGVHVVEDPAGIVARQLYQCVGAE